MAFLKKTASLYSLLFFTSALLASESEIHFQELGLDTLLIDPNSSQSPLEQFVNYCQRSGCRSATVKRQDGNVTAIEVAEDKNPQTQKLEISNIYFRVQSVCSFKNHGSHPTFQEANAIESQLRKHKSLVGALSKKILEQHSKDGATHYAFENNEFWQCRKHGCEKLNEKRIRTNIEYFQKIKDKEPCLEPEIEFLQELLKQFSTKSSSTDITHESKSATEELSTK